MARRAQLRAVARDGRDYGEMPQISLADLVCREGRAAYELS
jgi:hypothetical protein